MKINYKKIFALLFLITSCAPIENYNKNIILTEPKFSNKGFTIIYSNSADIKNLVSKKIENRSLNVFQRNLPKGTTVKITNLINGKSVIGKVEEKAKYPKFYNSVISKRIANEIDLDESLPYIEIINISNNSAFIAKKAKMFDEEKQVADKAPVESINIDNLNATSLEKKLKDESIKKTNIEFNFIIKIADFYFETSANSMKNRIIDDLKMKNVKITKISNNSYRVFIGPFKNINDLKISYNTVSQLEFENIEILKK